MRPISNVVDVTNYVIFEIGQPLHAYDLDRLDGRRLDRPPGPPRREDDRDQRQSLRPEPEMLVIADADRPVGLAGVMGGLETEIGASTRKS